MCITLEIDYHGVNAGRNKMASNNKFLSITLNNEYIKVTELSKKNKNTTTIHKAVTVPTPPRCYNDGYIRDRAELAKQIKIAIDSNRMESNKVIFSLASTKVVTKEVIIPSVKPKQIEGIITMNAKEYFPINLDEYLINYTVLEKIEAVTEEDNDKLKIMVMAMPEDMVNMYYEMASTLGFKIKAIDFVGNSTYQALKMQVDDSPSVVIQVENDATIINIMNKKVLQLQRTIPYGKSVVVNALMDAARMKYDPALRRLQEDPILHTQLGEDEVTDSLQILISNVSRVIDYYSTRNANATIEKAYIIGNATTIINFSELFGNELRLPVESLEVLKGIATDKKTYVESSMIPSYLINIGAFMSPVNFAPKSVEAENKSADDVRIYKIILGAAVAGSAIMLIGSFAMMISARAERDSAQVSVNQIKSIENVVSEYYQAKDLAADALTFQKLTLNNDDQLGQFVINLEKNLPSDVTVKSMNVKDGEVTMSCVGSSKSTVGLIIQKLQSIENVSEVLVGSVSEVKDDNGDISVTFSLTCRFVREELKATQAATGAASAVKATQAPTVNASAAASQSATGASAGATTQATTGSTAATTATTAAAR